MGLPVVNALSSRLTSADRDGQDAPHDHQRHPGVYMDADPANPSPIPPFKRTRKNRPTWKSSARYLPKPLVPVFATGMIRDFNKTAEFSIRTKLIDRVRQTRASGARPQNHHHRRKTYRKRRRSVEATDDATVEPAR